MDKSSPSTPADRPIRLFFSVGDVSADRHAANLIREILKLRPDAVIEGLGGPLMEKTGCEVRFRLTSMAVMWFSEVFKILHKVWRTQRDTLDYFETHRPDAVVLLDYPGYNLTLARWLRKRRIPVIYYIAPQIWAWFKHRIRKIRRRITQVLCIFPFEVDFYRSAGVPVKYVGHPLFDHLNGVEIDEKLCDELRRDAGESLIALLPGSRLQEVEKMLPVMARAAERLAKELKDPLFVVPCAGEEHIDVAKKILDRYDIRIKLVHNHTHEVMKAAGFAFVTSGTTTLELAHYNTPMAVIYRLPWWGYLIARTFMRTKLIGMVNILSGREVVPDRLMWRDDPEGLAQAALDVIRNPERRREVAEALRSLRERLDHPGASHEAAVEIVRFAEQYRGHVPDGGSQWPTRRAGAGSPRVEARSPKG